MYFITETVLVVSLFCVVHGRSLHDNNGYGSNSKAIDNQNKRSNDIKKDLYHLDKFGKRVMLASSGFSNSRVHNVRDRNQLAEEDSSLPLPHSVHELGHHNQRIHQFGRISRRNDEVTPKNKPPEITPLYPGYGKYCYTNKNFIPSKIYDCWYNYVLNLPHCITSCIRMIFMIIIPPLKFTSVFTY